MTFPCPYCNTTLMHTHKRALLAHAAKCDGLFPHEQKRAKLALKRLIEQGEGPREPLPMPFSARVINNRPQQYVDGLFRDHKVALTNRLDKE